MKKRTGFPVLFYVASKSILALSGGFCLLLALYAGLFVMLTSADLCEDAAASALSLPSLESAFQGFVFTDSDFHFFPSPLEQQLVVINDAFGIILANFGFVNPDL